MTLNEYINCLEATYNNPPRPHLGEIRTKIRLDESPLNIWNELLRNGYIPSEFVSSTLRHFGVSSDRDDIWPDDRPEEHPEPLNMAGVLTVASDPQGMLAAESHAREFARRLAPWTAVCDNRIVWYFTTVEYDPYYLGLAYDSARDTVHLSLCQHGIKESTYHPNTESRGLPSLVQRALAAWNGWQLAVQRNFEILEPKWPLDLTKWKRFSELENPFEPLLDLWCTGYRIVSNFESDLTIRLYAKPVSNDEISESK